MDPSNERAIAERARTQLGLITTEQLLTLGATRPWIRRRAASGALVRAGHRTWRVGGAPWGPLVEVLAACLDLAGVASHLTAAWLHQLLGAPPFIDITVAKGRSVAPWNPRVRVHTSTNLPREDVIDVGGIPTTSVARTMLGVAALNDLGDQALTTAVEEAVRRRLASDRWLWWMLEGRRCRGRNGVTRLEAVLAERARLGPTESWLEREVLATLAAAGLPQPVVQRRILRRGAFVARVDMAYEAERIVLEALGYASHSSREDQSRDAARASELQLAGWEVHQFTYDQVVSTPGHVVRVTSEALARARGRAA